MNTKPFVLARAGFPLRHGVAEVLTADPEVVSLACELARSETAAVDEARSRFRDDSELARANAAAGTPMTVGPLFAEVVSASLRAAFATDGDADPAICAGLEAAGYDRDIDGPAHHNLDPRTGTPADSPRRTVSVTAAIRVDANTASTAALVRGESATAWLERAGLPARLVRHDGRATTLGGRPCGLVAEGPS